MAGGSAAANLASSRAKLDSTALNMKTPASVVPFALVPCRRRGNRSCHAVKKTVIRWSLCIASLEKGGQAPQATSNGHLVELLGVLLVDALLRGDLGHIRNWHLVDLPGVLLVDALLRGDLGHMRDGHLVDLLGVLREDALLRGDLGHMRNGISSICSASCWKRRSCGMTSGTSAPSTSSICSASCWSMRSCGKTLGTGAT
mmetsp:Transcript_24646/g.77792  ORF Transcript_24646/g.77792 Transcript_24646/m.77792 type:complete len:201 (-) Transcript_24646:33-635(-)